MFTQRLYKCFWLNCNRLKIRTLKFLFFHSNSSINYSNYLSTTKWRYNRNGVQHACTINSNESPRFPGAQSRSSGFSVISFYHFPIPSLLASFSHASLHLTRTKKRVVLRRAIIDTVFHLTAIKSPPFYLIREIHLGFVLLQLPPIVLRK